MHSVGDYCNRSQHVFISLIRDLSLVMKSLVCTPLRPLKSKLPPSGKGMFHWFLLAETFKPVTDNIVVEISVIQSPSLKYIWFNNRVLNWIELTIDFNLLCVFGWQAFVENNPAIRWCPEAGCERAVRLNTQGPGTSTSDPLSFPLLRAPAVDCGKGHLFCWSVISSTPYTWKCKHICNYVYYSLNLDFWNILM